MLLPKAVEKLSFKDILERKKNKLKELVPDIANQLVDSDPAIALLEESCYTEGLLRDRINNSINAVMLDYANGSDLDNLGSLYGIKRKLIQEEDNTILPSMPAIWESDESFRKRIIEAPKGFSVAGPRSSYIYYGKLADSKVKDVSATSNSQMEVDICVLSYEGKGEASEELINKVYKQLNAEDIRPMGDKVVVNRAKIIDFEIEIDIIFKKNRFVDHDAIISGIINRLQNYVDKEHQLQGFISKAGIYSTAFTDNISNIRIISPVKNIKCTSMQAPWCTQIKVHKIL